MRLTSQPGIGDRDIAAFEVPGVAGGERRALLTYYCGYLSVQRGVIGRPLFLLCANRLPNHRAAALSKGNIRFAISTSMISKVKGKARIFVPRSEGAG